MPNSTDLWKLNVTLVYKASGAAQVFVESWEEHWPLSSQGCVTSEETVCEPPSNFKENSFARSCSATKLGLNRQCLP